MEKPKIIKTPDGSLTGAGCYLLCKYWAAEDEFEGRTKDARYWRDQAHIFKKSFELGLASWVAHPQINARLERENWKLIPWEERLQYLPRGQF